MSTDVGEFLAHYGVKGMKWGVRRSSSNSATPKKKRSEMSEEERRKDTLKKVAIGAGVVAALGLAAYSGKQIYNYQKTADKLIEGERFARRILKRYSDKDGNVFEAGTGFMRRSTMKETALNLRTYAVLEGVKNSSKHEQVKFGSNIIRIKSIDTMVSPSTKQRVDLIAKTLPLPPDDKVMKRLAAESASARSLGAKLAVKNFGDKQIGAIQLSRITASEWSWKNENTAKFIDALKKNGFSAVWDDWDEGTAHILFDADKIRYLTKA